MTSFARAWRIALATVSLGLAVSAGCPRNPRLDASATSGLRQYEHALDAVRALDMSASKGPDEATARAIANLGTIYRKLDRTDQAMAMQRTPTELRELVGIGVTMVEKAETIEAGWGHPAAYYGKILDALRTATPPDGLDHCFTVTIAADRVTLTPIADLPEGRGASTAKAVAKVVDGKLTAGYVFSDMGHAGVWGILFSDVDLPINTTAYTGGTRYWMFSDVGDRLFAHVYKAWNNID